MIERNRNVKVKDEFQCFKLGEIIINYDKRFTKETPVMLRWRIKDIFLQKMVRVNLRPNI